MEQGKIYKMNWSTGKMKELQKAPELKRGHIIYAYGAYCNFQKFVVTDPSSRKCVEMDEPVNSVDELPERYFSERHTYDSHMEPHSRKFGIGFYYADGGESLVSEDDIIAYERRAERIAELREEKKRMDEEARKADIARLRKEYGGILTEVENRGDKNAVMKNVRALLKHRFPGVKFSARKESYDTLRICWTDGPKRDDVERLADMFEGKTFNGMEDIEEIIHSNFTDLYGAMGYAFTERNISYERKSEMAERLKGWFPVLNDEEGRFDNCEVWNSGRNNDVPENIRDIVLSFNRGGQNLSQWAEFVCYNMDFTERREPEKAEPKENVVKGEYTIIDYSEKAIAVTGDTKAIKDILKSLGGRFNPRLTCGPGWIFSKSKESAVRAAIC